MLPSTTISASDQAAFDDYVAETNRRRVIPATLSLAALLSLALVGNFVGHRPKLPNALGLATCALNLAFAKWAKTGRLVGVVFGLTTLWWGVPTAMSHVTEIVLGHPALAADQFAVFIITRYFAAIVVIWKPRDLAIALASCHLFVMFGLAPVNPSSAYLFTPIWTTTAWVAGFMIYRAEREAFFARRVLQQQRDELEAANAHLAQLNQEKNDLMAIAAHDLRSPLMGMATLLHLTADDASRAWTAGTGALQAAEQSCRDLVALVSRMLDIHEAEETMGALTLVSQDVRPVVSSAVDAHRARADAKRIHLALDMEAEPGVAVYDALALARVLDNLLSNAVKFSAAGGSVNVRVERRGTGASIQVSDSGPGFSKEERLRLFRKFARLSARPTGGESSSGLGLYISKRLMDAMGGTIATLAPVEGIGSTFEVTLKGASV